MEDLIWAVASMSVPIAAILAGVIGRWIKLKERQLELTSRDVAEKAAQYAAKTERLESRVAVLERILTDRSRDLGEEIERLRDRPLN